jgi:predicted secreted protein
MRQVLVVCALAAVLLGASAAAAQERPAEFDVISLQAQASRDVDNDLLIAVLALQLQGSDPAELADTANRRMDEILKTAAEFPVVRLRSGSYQTTPRYREKRMDGWQLSQELRLESPDFAAASRLIARLQQGLVVRSMSVRLSAEARRAAENGLIVEALDAFRVRAELVRRSMQSSGYKIRTLDIGTGGGAPPPVPLMARAEAAPVAIEAGVSQVTVTVSGSIQLR